MKSLPEDEVSSANIAYLEDRVRVNHGLPQLYGTQFYKEGELFGPRPIEDIANLDARRAAAGLEPFKNMKKQYANSKRATNPKQAKKPTLNSNEPPELRRPLKTPKPTLRRKQNSYPAAC